MPGYRAIFGFILGLGLLQLCGAHLVAAILSAFTVQPANGLSPPVRQLLHLGIVASRRNWLFTLTPRMGRDWSLIALLATLPFYGVAVPYVLGGGTAGGSLASSWRVASTALPCLHAVGVVRDRGRLHRVAGALPHALKSSGEPGDKFGRQCLHGLPDPSGGARRFFVCLPRGDALSPAQMGHRGAHHAPAVLPGEPLDPQDSPGQPSAVKDKTEKEFLHDVRLINQHPHAPGTTRT